MTSSQQTTRTFLLCCLGLALLSAYAHATPQTLQEPLQDPTPRRFLVDRYMSPYASSACLMASRTLLSEVEDAWVDPPPHCWGRYASAVWNNLADDILMLTSHEVHGHGFRRRSFHRPVAGYGLMPLFGGITLFLTPVNGLGGYTTYGIIDAETSSEETLPTNTAHTHASGATKNMSIDEAVLEVIAGNEANSVLANEIVLQHFSRRTLDYRDYNLFFKAFTNLLGYVVITNESGTHGATGSVQGDIEEYLAKINQKQGVQGGIDLRDLRRASFSFFLNPILYTSIWSFYAHIAQGQRTFQIPHLMLGHTAYLPIVRAGLTPFGILYYLDNYVGQGRRTLMMSLQAGQSPLYTQAYGGVQLRTHRLWEYKQYSLDVEGHLWRQPPLQFEPEATLQDKSHWGGLVGMDHQLQLSPLLALHVATLYKTAGFAEGVVAEKGWVLRGGIALCY